LEQRGNPAVDAIGRVVEPGFAAQIARKALGEGGCWIEQARGAAPAPNGRAIDAQDVPVAIARINADRQRIAFNKTRSGTAEIAFSIRS
jgi:hypothetical protein